MISPIAKGDNPSPGCNIAAMEVRGERPVGRVGEFGVAFAAGAALLVASLVNFLDHNAYPYVRAEIGLVVLAMLALAALMALWYLPQRQWGRSLLEGALAALFLDLNTDSIPLIVGGGIAVAAFSAWRRTSLLGPMAVLGSVVLVTTAMGLGGGPAWLKTVKGDASGSGDPNLPAVVHIILDEHLGLEGLRSEGAAGQALAEELRAFYLANGFAIYGGAYSQHYHSANSIPFILNYGKRLGVRAGHRGAEAGQTEHLKLLVGAGYRLNLYQSDFVDVCSGAYFHRCTTYESASLRPTLSVPMSVNKRTELVGQKFLKLSDMFWALSQGYNVAASNFRKAGIQLPMFNSLPAHSSSVASLRAFDLFIEELKSARPGEAYFAHFILPHHPYAFRRDCSFRKRPWNGLTSETPVGKMQLEYYEQVRCATRRVESALSALARSKAGSNSIIVIHGDHGSRLTRVDLPAPSPNGVLEGNVIAAFSTLFAVRGPGLVAAENDRPQAVASLLTELAQSGLRAAPAADRPLAPIYLAGPKLEPLGTIPIPRVWAEKARRSK